MSEEGPVVGPGFEAMKPLLNEAGHRRRMGQGATEIPIPPLEMRQLVGPTDPALFDNPSAEPIFPNLPVSAYDAVFDFGCGCGRIARQLLQQQPRPSRYVGVDIHRGMIEWCQNNLSTVDGNFVFHHHDVFNLGHAPDNTKQLTAPFEVEDSAFSLILAWSVFTHVYEQQALHYLNEIARIMRPDGRFISTWFLFDKREFPMMQDFQNTLFINEIDPTNAVIYDREWVLQAVAASGLVISDVEAPSTRGYHWRVTMTHQKPGGRSVEFPPDTAPYGSIPPPLLPLQDNGSSEGSPASETHEDQDLAQNSDPSEKPPISEMPVDKEKLSANEVQAAVDQVEHWYHSIQVAPGIVTPGVHDSNVALQAMEVPERLEGKRVLDVGARDGFFSFVAEARGAAEVLAIDSVAPEHLSAFATASRLLGSSVEYRTLNVYDVRPENVGTFDVIFFLGVLYHLRDPLLALDRLWAVARPGATIWVESHVIDRGLVDPATGNWLDLASMAPELVEVPIAQFYPKDLLGGNFTNWWGPNLAGLKAMVESAGFEIARARLIGTRGLVVGHKTEDTETSFYREFDRSARTGEEGMAWHSSRQWARSPQSKESNHTPTSEETQASIREEQTETDQVDH